MDKTYCIEITTRVVSYRDEQGEWLEGDCRELESPSTSVQQCDEDDIEAHGSAVGWAVDRLDRTDVVEASMHPIPDAVREHDWLSGFYQDPYQGDAHVTETTVRLTGDWAPEERARIFRAAVRTDRHGA